jgi:hypothetical protein
MTVKLREKPDEISRPAGQPVPEVVGMQHDGSQATATGLVVWAGSQGKTLNLQYRGGDADDWVIVDPGHDEGSEYRIITAGGWLLSDGTEMWLTQGLGPYEVVGS